MTKKISKNKLIIGLLIVAIIFIISIAVHLFYRPYMAVHLITGDIYFGRTTTFPNVQISDPWFLQRAEDGNFGLTRFSDAVWAPQGRMKINRDKIVFMSKIAPNSPVIATMEGRNVQQPIGQGTPQNINNNIQAPVAQ